MSMATRAGTQPPALPAADSHDLISVHGARVNNLKDVSIEIPKRREDGRWQAVARPYWLAPSRIAAALRWDGLSNSYQSENPGGSAS